MTRLHLRGGLLAIARAALEQMAGAGTLDTEALADLAEVRWRSGDLEGAAEAARAHRAFGGQEPMADLILAEALFRRGRQPEAFRHSEAVGRRVGPALDILFAGEPRSGASPGAEPPWVDAGATLAGRYGLLIGGREVAAPTPRTWPPAASVYEATVPGAAAAPERVHATPPAARRMPGTSPLGGRVAGRELEAVERLFEGGQYPAATERLAVLLRMDAALAPVILSLADQAIATGGAGAEGLSALHVVRGDAYRGMGREIEADAAYQEALRALPARPAAKESP